MKTEKLYGLTDTPLSAADLVSIHQSHLSYFEDLWESGKENERYRMGRNLSEAQEADYLNQDRIPFPSAITADKLNRIISSERNSKTVAKAEATKPESEVKAELLSMRFRKVEQDSDLQYVESEIFESGVAMKYGVGKIIVDYDRKGRMIIKVVDVDYLNCIWDSSARRYDKADGTFFAERKKVYRRDIAKDYGRHIADNIAVGWGHFGRDENDYWGISNKDGQMDNDIISVFEHYQKVLRDYWCVIWKGEIVSKENSKKDAEEVLRMLKVPFIIQGVPIPPAGVQKHPDYGYDKYIFTCSEILEYEQTDMEFYPYHVYQAFNFKDKIWSMTDILKPKNKMMDKLLAQVDYAFATDIKNAGEIVEPWLHPGVTVEEAINLYKRGELVPVIRPNALNFPKTRGANPQWLTVMEILKSDITEMSGGALFSTGQQSGASREAKETVQRKLRQQELVATMFVDNLRRWKRSLFQKVIWFLDKYDTEEQIIKVHGGKLSPEMIAMLQRNKIYSPSQNYEGVGYLTVNQPGNKLSYLNDAEVDIIVVEENLSDTEKEVQYSRMVATERSDPSLTLSPTWRRLKLEKIDVSFEDRQRIIGEIEQAMQAQREQAQQDKMMEFEQEQQKINTEKARVIVQDKGNQVGTAKDKGNGAVRKSMKPTN